MACYIVTFQTASETSRQKVIEKLKSYQYYCPIHDNCWAILTDQSAANIRDAVITVMSTGERLFVIRSGTEGAWLNTYGNDNSDWLKKNL